MRLWYQSPAEDWNSALPLGNGKLGAMVFGGPVAERIQLNEDSVWSGGFRDRVNPDCKNNLPEIRRLYYLIELFCKFHKNQRWHQRGS